MTLSGRPGSAGDRSFTQSLRKQNQSGERDWRTPLRHAARGESPGRLEFGL